MAMLPQPHHKQQPGDSSVYKKGGRLAGAWTTWRTKSKGAVAFLVLLLFLYQLLSSLVVLTDESYFEIEHTVREALFLPPKQRTDNTTEQERSWQASSQANQQQPPGASTVRHVAITVYKCHLFNCSARRQAAEDNSRQAWTQIARKSNGTIEFVDFSDTKRYNIALNPFGVPVLSSMYLQAERMFPKALTWMYVNADILPENNFYETVDAALEADTTPFLLVGRRCNVDWFPHFNISDFDDHFLSRGHLANHDAEDYFVASRGAIDWAKIPPFVIGRRAYDNWLVDHVYHHKVTRLIDGTKTIRIIHQTDEMGNFAHGSNHAKSLKDTEYNAHLGRGKWDHGRTDNAQYESYYLFLESGRRVPKIRRREPAAKLVIVVRVSRTEWDLFENWLYHFERQSVSLEKLVVTCVDDETFSEYSQGKRLPMEAHIRRDSATLPSILQHELQYVDKLIYTAVDTVWVSDPGQNMHNLQTVNRDTVIFCATDRHDFGSNSSLVDVPKSGANDNPPRCRTGFLFIRKTTSVISLLREWADKISLSSQQNHDDNLPTENATLERDIFRQLVSKSPNVKVTGLAPVTFPDAIEYFVDGSHRSKDVIIVRPDHVDGADAKMDVLRSVGLWNVSSDLTMRRQANEGLLDPPFTIVVLTMDRFASLKRLLKSLFETDYLSDKVDLVIRFDRPSNPTDSWLQAVEEIRTYSSNWEAGQSRISVSSVKLGLRQAWLDAWKPQSASERAIIFEDDVEVSPQWYKWLRGAIDAYRGRPDVAGISLQRQSLVPLKSAQGHKIPDNNGQPFLYKLPGSIGYSPMASIWLDFLDFAECALASKVDVSVPGLITSDWYRALDKTTMWTQLFIYFCNHRNLSSLYLFPSQNLALAAHWREKGEHHGSTQGRDFPVLPNTTDYTFEYPTELVSLDWDARPIQPKPKLRSLVMSAAIGYGQTEFRRFVVQLRKFYSGDIALLISISASPEIKQLLVKHNVTVVETTDQGGARESAAWHRIIKSRYNFYQEACREGAYDLCMMLDFRDVLFQGDPFAHVTMPAKPTLHLYLHNLKVNNWAVNIANTKCEGATNKLNNSEWMINAGGLIASPSVIRRLATINEDFGTSCDDQVALNLAVYNRLFEKDAIQVILHRQGEGSINNPAYDGVFRRDSRQRILNHNCFPSAVVHQFDAIESTKGQSRLP